MIYASNVIANSCFVGICCVNIVEQNLLPKSQTKPFYIRTKEAPSMNAKICYLHALVLLLHRSKSFLRKRVMHCNDSNVLILENFVHSKI